MSTIKIVFALISTLVAVAAFIPYFRDILSRKTQPHAYSWLVWSITQGTATAGLWYGGGGEGAWSLIIGTLLVIAVFIFSLKYGTKNITPGDTITLIAALCAVAVWWRLDQPVLAVLMVSVIDMFGYVPSFRKSFVEPWSETVGSWTGLIISNIFAIGSLREYNVLTLSYLITLFIANTILVGICLVRRSSMSSPQRIK